MLGFTSIPDIRPPKSPEWRPVCQPPSWPVPVTAAVCGLRVAKTGIKFELRFCTTLSVAATKPRPLFRLHCSRASMFWCQHWRDARSRQQYGSGGTNLIMLSHARSTRLNAEAELTTLWLKSPPLNRMNYTPKPPKIRHIRRNCTCRRKSAVKSSA